MGWLIAIIEEWAWLAWNRSENSFARDKGCKWVQNVRHDSGCRVGSAATSDECGQALRVVGQRGRGRSEDPPHW